MVTDFDFFSIRKRKQVEEKKWAQYEPHIFPLSPKKSNTISENLMWSTPNLISTVRILPTTHNEI